MFFRQRNRNDGLRHIDEISVVVAVEVQPWIVGAFPIGSVHTNYVSAIVSLEQANNKTHLSAVAKRKKVAVFYVDDRAAFRVKHPFDALFLISFEVFVRK